MKTKHIRNERIAKQRKDEGRDGKDDYKPIGPDTSEEYKQWVDLAKAKIKETQ